MVFDLRKFSQDRGDASKECTEEERGAKNANEFSKGSERQKEM